MTLSDTRTLGDILSEPSIALIAPHAIAGMDLTQQPWWGKTLAELRQENFGGDLKWGLARLLRASDTGCWYFPLYTQEECAGDPARERCSLVWLPSDDPAADERPFMFLIPGGGFENVWSLTEGWPVADHYNCAGYHCFVLTYQVGSGVGLLDREMDDISRALDIIRAQAAMFHVDPDRYVTCGFSAGGYITCLWSTMGKGWKAHGQPRPQAMIPVYPFISFRQLQRDHDDDPEFIRPLFYTDIARAVNEDYEIPEHTAGFPPCRIFVCQGDTLVPCVHSKLLHDAVVKEGIPCDMEMCEGGWHGFAEGTGSPMAGWCERAVEWLRKQGL